MFAILFAIFIAIFIYYFIKINFGSGNLPPGPLKLPIIGNVYYLWFGKEFTGVKFQKLNKVYGKLATIQYGTITLIITEDLDIVRGMLTNDIWADRMPFKVFEKFTFEKNYGIIFTIGETWKRHRRFTLQTLKDFGFGKKFSMENFIHEEIKILSDKIDASIDSGKNILPVSRMFTISVLNILWGMIAGIRFSHDNLEINQMMNKIYEISKMMAFGKNPVNAFPKLAPYVNMLSSKSKNLNAKIDDLQNYIRDCLLKRRSESTYKYDQRDFIDVFLKLIDESKNGPDKEIFNDDAFVAITLDLFMAGAETSNNSMEFLILYTILNPWVQDKVQNEIERAVGKSRFPTLEDKPNMPFTEAVIYEVQRMAVIVPNLGRGNYVDTNLEGYFIPKNSLLFVNLYGLHMNEKIWEEPAKFNPKRFIDKDGQIVNTNKIYSFGGGKRACIGEVLAKSTLFIYYSTLMQKYKFSIPQNEPTPSTIPEYGFTLNARPFNVKIEYRT